MQKQYFTILFFLFFSACNNEIKIEQPQKINYKIDFRKLTNKEKNIYYDSINSFYNAVLKNYFSGGFLVAKNGEIIFEKYNGIYNTGTNENVTSTSPIHIASVSKTFTAISILKLYEQGKLKLEDSIQQYFPSFPYHNVSIKDLLSHRSGLPNYLYCMDTAWKSNAKASNIDVLNYLTEKQPPAYAMPNRMFHYCNTNYVLLALIVEQIAQKTFPDFLQETIFKPLGMNNTFVFSAKDTLRYVPSYSFSGRPFMLEPFDCIYGDKNIYSTARDLFLWDEALYNNDFIKKETLQKAFTPYSNEKPGHRNYGFGWRLYIDENDTTIYHNGWWHGNNAHFSRLIKDSATIIVIGNKYNRSIYTARQLSKLFSGKEQEQDYEE